MNEKAFRRFEAQVGQIDDQEYDRDRTLRALEGFSDDGRNGQEAQTMDYHDQRQNGVETEDLFLNLARDDTGGQSSEGVGANMSRTERRMVSPTFFSYSIARHCIRYFIVT
jgi:hypothetical protein